MLKTFSQPLPIFILQLVVIIVAARLFRYFFSRMKQPPVMGEIVAGIVLGPSVAGAISPQFTAFLFPPASLGNLQMLSQVGLILFMFVIGMELDIVQIKQKAGTVIFVSLASILFPFALGMGLSGFLYQKFAPVHISFYSFALFMGIAMSITAFPVLARVIREKQLTQSRIGVISLTAAALGDAMAWCMLAFVVAFVKAGNTTEAAYTIIGAVVYILVMFALVKPLLKKFAVNKIQNQVIKRSMLAIVFIILLLSAYCTEVIGIHALFGAFVAGVIMPQEWGFRKIVTGKIEDIALVLLLPLFFVLTGLRTQIGLLNEPALWLYCLLIISAAVAGKFGGSSMAARITGENWRDSFGIGALMNTRGLVELVVLNVGYDLGILSSKIFTIMVLMALVTTLMTGPLLDIINKKAKSE